MAQLVGPTGSVWGVDMTEEQISVADRHRLWHAEAFGYDNVTFRLGYIEELEALGLVEASFDVIVSNCVVNLSPRKEKIGVGHRFGRWIAFALGAADPRPQGTP